jgi:hypothetical protein
MRVMTDPDTPQTGLLRITIEHTPSPNDPEGADEFYRALGIFVVAWGRLEGQFVVCLLSLLNLSTALGLPLETKLPMGFDDRATVWRKAFAGVSLLQPLKEGAMTILQEMKELSEHRHKVIHALWEPFAPTEPPSIQIVTIKHKNKTENGLEVGRHTVTTATLTEMAEEADRLNIAMGPLSQIVTRLRAAQNPPPENIRTI